MEHLDINLDMCAVDHISEEFNPVLSCHCYSCDNTLYNTWEPTWNYGRQLWCDFSCHKWVVFPCSVGSTQTVGF